MKSWLRERDFEILRAQSQISFRTRMDEQLPVTDGVLLESGDPRFAFFVKRHAFASDGSFKAGECSKEQRVEGRMQSRKEEKRKQNSS